MSKQVKANNQSRSAKAKRFSWKVSLKSRKPGRLTLPAACSCCGGCK